jgi:hypothetical protein
MSKYTSPVASAINKTAAELTHRIQALAERAQWPAGIVDVLCVEYKDGRFKVVFPSSVAPTVDLLEHGGQDLPPAGLIRRFEATIGTKGGALLLDFAAQELRKVRAL